MKRIFDRRLRRIGFGGAVRVWPVAYAGDASYHMDPDLAQFGVSYTVEPTDIESKIVSVSIELTPDKLSPDRMFYLDIGEVEASEPVCTDADGTEIALNNLGSAWEIGPVSEDCESVVFQYDVKLGENTGVDFQVDGDLYEDLLAFQGKKVLMMPLFDSNNLTHMESTSAAFPSSLRGAPTGTPSSPLHRRTARKNPSSWNAPPGTTITT